MAGTSKYGSQKTASIVSAPGSFRFLAKSGHTGYRSNISDESSYSLAAAVANKQKTRLHMRHVEDRRSLLQKDADFCHQREREKADLRLQHEQEGLIFDENVSIRKPT